MCSLWCPFTPSVVVWSILLIYTLYMSRGRKKKKIIPSLKLKPSTVQSIFFIFFSLLAALSVFSFLQTGPIPTQFNLFLTDSFGFAAIAVPFLLVLIAFLFAKFKSPLKEPNVFLGFTVMFLSSISLFKSGLVGRFFWYQIMSLFGIVPTFFIFFFTPGFTGGSASAEPSNFG